MNPNRLNKVIHGRVRLAVMSALAARGSLTFIELKKLLKVTDGNLSVQARTLEQKKMITVTKDFDGRKPRTTFELTEEGRTQFALYVKELENIIKLGKAPE